MKITVDAIQTTKRKNKNRFTTKLPKIVLKIWSDDLIKEYIFDSEEFSAASACSVTGTNSIQQILVLIIVMVFFAWRAKITIVSACGYGISLNFLFSTQVF